jgi:hypothetical protein
MSPEPSLLEVDSLKRVEHLYRTRLTSEPTDMIARVSLAWCLFMQALHRAGQESVLQQIVAAGETADPERRVSDGREGSSDLLRDCLRQAIMVIQLSPDQGDREDVERLHALVKLSGGDRALSEASEEAARILTDMTREILAQPAQSPRRLRRLRRRTPEA